MRWLILKSNYVIDVILWDGITPYDYPHDYDIMVEDTIGVVTVGDWYEVSEGVFYRPINVTSPWFPPNS